MAVTIKDIAEKVGVSTATVSRALNNIGYVKEDTRKKILEIADSLGYERYREGDTTKAKTNQIGVIVSDVTNPFFTQVVRGIEDVLSIAGYSLLLCNADENVEKEMHYLRILKDKRVDGIILAPARGDHRGINEITDRGICLVLIDRLIDGLDVDAVVIDNISGAYEGVSHLISEGYRKIAMITGPLEVMTARERLEGYKKALRDNGIDFDENLVENGKYTQDGGYRATKTLIERVKPDALFVANNVMTTGALLAIKELGLKIPEEIGIVGFDDLEWAPLIDPPLTTISQPIYTIGSTAAQLLLRRLGRTVKLRKEVVILKPKLIIRESSRRGKR
ncbi:MAG: LacI family DNA-binding transcriptional regulator [bacterium]